MPAQLVVENNILARTLLRPNPNENEEYDVIVIGSGMGGGVIASALADEKKKVLVLEAGPLLFPTHVGNLPRRLLAGKFQKHIWSLWEDFKVVNYKNVGGEYKGGQAFGLGGRSLFWGSSIPELAKWELDVWPKAIQDYLLDKSPKGGYEIARGVFNSDVPELKAFHQKATNELVGVLGEDKWDVLPAPVAVEYSGATEWSVPCGIFSSADLLLEDSMIESVKEGQPWREPLTVNVNHAVWNVVFDPNDNKRAIGVRCDDMQANRVRTYRAKSVVLSAGTLESAKIALASGIKNPLIGVGIVDHAIHYRHFVIPPNVLKELKLEPEVSKISPPRVEPQSTKILIRHKAATLNDYAFDIVLELGAQFNQGRIVDRDHLEDDLQLRNGYLLCEIVFQFYAPLKETNRVALGGAPDEHDKPLETLVERVPVPDKVFRQAQETAKTILNKFGAQSVFGEDAIYGQDGLPDLKVADVGGVAHEVGTLRMPVEGKPGVVDENLKFEGYKNLFACDNSVFPCSPAGNPSLTLVALARRCAKAVAAIV